MAAHALDATVIQTALNRLDFLHIDEYIIAHGPDGNRFHGSPNGYSATCLLAKILAAVSAGLARRVVWASFGSEPDSWFFALEKPNGKPTVHIGSGIPLALREFILEISGSLKLLKDLRIQLGDNESFVVWTQTYVAIDPYALAGESFAFIKKKQESNEAPYIIHFDYHTSTNIPFIDESSQPDMSLQRVAQQPESPSMNFRWASSKKSGRPHVNESWEINLKKGERIKVLRDMGRDWFVVEVRGNMKGWVHGSWMNFDDVKVHAEPKMAYNQFQEDIKRMLVPGQLRSFPIMTDYVDTCTETGCQLLKENTSSLGICGYDLMVLLKDSGCYSYDWLKEGRNLWHPDRFARYCYLEHAEQMFVLYGLLMEAA